LFAGDRDHDRGPFEVVRLRAEQAPVGVKHYVQMRSGIDAVPSIAILGHGLLHPLWLWLFRHHSSLLSQICMSTPPSANMTITGVRAFATVS
jgi:hypothetical protein